MKLPLRALSAPALLLLHACVAGGSRDPGTELHDTLPNITQVLVDCSVDNEEWTFQVTTDAWTANGTLFLATEADYLEQHSLRSEEAAADGSGDLLTLSLAIEDDWRAASSGSSTAFLCNASTEASISWRIFVYTPGTGDASDCTTGGANPPLFEAFAQVPACEGIWTPDTGA